MVEERSGAYVREEFRLWSLIPGELLGFFFFFFNTSINPTHKTVATRAKQWPIIGLYNFLHPSVFNQGNDCATILTLSVVRRKF